MKISSEPETRAKLIAASWATAAEHDRLKEANEHWHLRVSQMMTDIESLEDKHDQLVEALELAEATIIRLTSVDSNKRASVQGTLDVCRTARASDHNP